MLDSGLRRIALLLLAFVALAGAMCTPPARDATRTALLLPAFFAQWPVNPAGWGSGPLERSDLDLGDEYPGAALHIYRPRDGHYPALLISLGVGPAARDDPRVVRFLQGLARAGTVAVLVESPALDDGYLHSDAPDLLVAAFQTMERLPYVEPSHIGFVGLSVGGSLALLAAADPRISARVRLVEAFGAYGSLPRLLRAASTESFEEGGALQHWQPDATTLWDVHRNLIALLPSADDRAVLDPLFTGDSPIPSQAPASLSPEGRTVFGLLTASSPAQFDSLYADLPSEARSNLEALSPEPVLGRVRAPVYLMVDQADPLVPSVESRRIAAALRQAGHPAYFSQFDIFRHVVPTRGGSAVILTRDLLRLFLHVAAVLERLGSGS